ncbi:MAG TPA: MFS transporter [Candidatus Hydrogenedentes bacterium]|nr:MFS transporter [Candidatus Hydrogenedentota bacterium]HQM50496.1 MFS transporter [Candidatus Hydrogenedentota bacterium]
MLIKIVAVSGVFCLGFCFALLGSLSVKIMPRLGIGKAAFGTLVAGFMFSSTLSCLALGFFVDALGYRPIAVSGFVGVALCTLLLARCRAFAPAMAACILLGLCAMSVNTAGNTLITITLFDGTNPAAASNLGNVFFGAGLLLTPLLASVLFERLQFDRAVSLLAIFPALPVLPALFAQYPAIETGYSLASALAIVREPAVIAASVWAFFYSSIETVLSSWLPSCGKEVFERAEPGVAEAHRDASAQRLLSYFALAIIASRVGMSLAPWLAAHGVPVVTAGSMLLILSLAGLRFAQSSRACRLCVIVAGLGIGPCYPTTLGMVFSKFYPGVYGTIFGTMSTLGMFGGTVAPKIIGNIAQRSSVQRALLWLIPACLLLTAAIFVTAALPGRGAPVP